MTKPITLTANELTALRLCLNYDDRQSQLDDNFSNGGHAEFKKALGWTDKQVAALIKSLEAKGLGWGDDNDGNGHIFWLTEAGVNAVFDVYESHVENLKTAYYDTQKMLLEIDPMLVDEGADRENASEHDENSPTFWRVMFGSSLEGANLRAEEAGIKLPDHLKV